MASRVSSPTFVGRRVELDRVATSLAEVRLGQPRLVLVGGEAGVGKTRFVRELERLAVSGQNSVCSRVAACRSEARACRSAR